MEIIDLSLYDWKDIQEKHNNGVLLKDLGISRKILKKAEDSGVFIKNKIHRKWSDDEKEKISKKRKEWLSKNPDKHPWKRHNKYKSVPCEFLKEGLKKIGVEFFDEVNISKEKNYSVDILIPSKNLIIEVNGNQHYDKNKNLKPYYQERHDYICSLGWKVFEIHYSTAFNIDFCKKLIDDEKSQSMILPFYKPEKKRAKYGSRKCYNDCKRKESYEKNKEKIKILKESGIDFSRFGWSTKASKVLNIRTQKVSGWMSTYMPEFYQNNCYRIKR
jgi:hypothetical protein